MREWISGALAALSLLWGAAVFAAPGPETDGAPLLVAHDDPLTRDPALTLRRLVEITLEQYPRQHLAGALVEEAQALRRRAETFFPGYPSVFLQWIDDTVGMNLGVRQVQTGIQTPLWMWGQRAAGARLAEQAGVHAQEFARALRHEVAGLVRESLWGVTLAENRRTLAGRHHELAEQFLGLIRLRVGQGDLAQTDLLLAESDALEKRAARIDAEAELMHARRAFINLTRVEILPADFGEERSPQQSVPADHPTLAVAQAAVERFRGETEWARKSKQGTQPTVLVGTQHDWYERGMARDDQTNLVVQVPFGGSAYNAPVVAEAGVRLGQALAEREALVRSMEKTLHEVTHALQVDAAQFATATRRRELAERNLAIARIAFDSGEQDLLDFLKIQTQAQRAVLDAEQVALHLRRDVARYNQIVGVEP